MTSKNRLSRLLYRLPPWLLTIVVSVAILYLTLVPRPVPQEMILPFPGFDKIVHGLMFFALAGAIVIDYTRRRRCSRLRLVTSLAAAIAISAGAAIELLQRLMALGRSMDAADILADALGALLGSLLAAALARRLHPRP